MFDRPGKWTRDLMRSWVSTGSLRSAWLLNTARHGSAELSVPGVDQTLRIRTGTSDAWHLRAAVDSDFDLHEYRVPVALRPEVVLDIGANTGIVALSLHRAWPHARIIAVEPLPENFDLLKFNVRGCPEITPLCCGLGCERTTLDYYLSDDPNNMAGGTFYPAQDNLPHRHGKLQIVTPRELLDEQGIERVDVIKIDTEGAEYDILSSFPEDVLSQVKVIVGELHGVRDAEVLDLLRRWFEVECTPSSGRLSFFKAINKTRSPACGRIDIKEPSCVGA